jgi:MFS family permease
MPITGLRLILTAPALFIAIGAPIAGTIIDRFGRKACWVLAVFLYGLAGSSGFFAERDWANAAGAGVLLA